MKTNQQFIITQLRSLLCDIIKEKEFFYIKNEILINYSNKTHNIIQLKLIKELILYNNHISNSITLMSRI